MNVKSDNNEEPVADKAGVTSDLFQSAYDSLHDLAARYLYRERRDHTLQPTALLHEAFLRLEKGKKASGWNGKTHFQAVAARAMRQILVDHARQKKSQKRGGEWNRVNLSTGILGSRPTVDFIVLDEALTDLASMDQRKADVVELRFFGGLTNAEAAERLDISPKTAEADWYFARAWLGKRLAENERD